MMPRIEVVGFAVVATKVYFLHVSFGCDSCGAVGANGSRWPCVRQTAMEMKGPDLGSASYNL